MRLRVLAILLFPLLGFASEQWTEIKSPHFTVVTDAGEKRGRDVALRFEQMRQVFGSLVLRGEVKTSRPVQILAFKNTKGIRQVAPLFKGKPVEVAGLYQKGQSGDYIALDLSTEGDYKWQTVFHEYAHLLLNSNTMEWPLWFDEGFAEFFSTIDLSGKQALIGRAPESAAQMIVNNRLIPVAQLFSVQHDSATYNENGDHRNMFYAESWLIVHYLYDKQLVRQAITSFAVSKGRPDEAEFRKNVGMGFSDFDSALRDYIRGNRLIGWNTAPPSGIDANSFAARAITVNDALVAVAEMHANGLDHAEEGIRELEQALSVDSGNVKAQSDLGYAYLRKSDYAHAEPYLEKAASSGSNDAMIHYYYAMLLQQKFQGGVPSDQHLARQKTELEQAIALNPSLAEGYNLLSFNARLRGDSPAAIDAALRAVALDQRNENYALNLANLYLSAQKIPEAQSVIDRLGSSENTQTLTAIASMRSYISQWQNYRQAAEAYKKQNETGSDDAEKSRAQQVSPSVTLRLADERNKSPRQILEGLLVQVNCSSAGQGTLFIQKGGRLIQLHFRSFADIVDPDSGDLSCGTKEKRVVAESTIDGTVQKLSLAK
jgi:tetratricopeptide (TPR) repeat protein